jgi:hypothetical protein
MLLIDRIDPMLSVLTKSNLEDFLGAVVTVDLGLLAKPPVRLVGLNIKRLSVFQSPVVPVAPGSFCVAAPFSPAKRRGSADGSAGRLAFAALIAPPTR